MPRSGIDLNETSGLNTVCRVMNTVIDGYIEHGKRIDPLQTTYVEPVLLRVRAPLVVCVDSANPTEVVLGGLCVELVELEVLGARHNVDSGKRY